MCWHLRRNTRREVRYRSDLCTQTIGSFRLGFAAESAGFRKTRQPAPLPASHLSSPLQAISILRHDPPRCQVFRPQNQGRSVFQFGDCRRRLLSPICGDSRLGSAEIGDRSRLPQRKLSGPGRKAVASRRRRTLLAVRRPRRLVERSALYVYVRPKCKQPRLRPAATPCPAQAQG